MASLAGKDKTWDRMTPAEQAAATTLGYDGELWDAGATPEACMQLWRQLRRHPAQLAAAQALGYAELNRHLDGRCTLDQAIGDIVIHTRQFAVRQERWFRRDPRIRWVHIEKDPVSEIAPILAEHLR